MSDARITPRNIHFRIIFEPDTPPVNISFICDFFLSLFFIAFFNSLIAEKFFGSSTLFGFSGRTPLFTNWSKIIPEIMAIAIESKRKVIIHLKPTKAQRISVSEMEFHGLAIRNAIVWPRPSPRL